MSEENDPGKVVQGEEVVIPRQHWRNRVQTQESHRGCMVGGWYAVQLKKGLVRSNAPGERRAGRSELET